MGSNLQLGTHGMDVIQHSTVHEIYKSISRPDVQFMQLMGGMKHVNRVRFYIGNIFSVPVGTTKIKQF